MLRFQGLLVAGFLAFQIVYGSGRKLPEASGPAPLSTPGTDADAAYLAESERYQILAEDLYSRKLYGSPTPTRIGSPRTTPRFGEQTR